MDYEFLWAAIRFNSTDSNKTWIFIFLDVTISHKPNSKQQEPILSQQQPTYTYVIQKMSKQNCHVTCLLQWAWTKQSAFSNFYFSFNFAFQFLVKSTEKKKNASKAPFYFTFSHNDIRDLSVCVFVCRLYTHHRYGSFIPSEIAIVWSMCDPGRANSIFFHSEENAPIQSFSISKKRVNVERSTKKNASKSMEFFHHNRIPRWENPHTHNVKWATQKR